MIKLRKKWKQILLPFLEIFKAESPKVGTGLPMEARTPRQKRCVSIRSPKLPGGRALTVDVASKGICVETFTPVQVGEKLGLELEIGPFPVRVCGEVVWCKEFTKGIYRLGVDLKDSRLSALHVLSRFLDEDHRSNSRERNRVLSNA